MSEETNEGTGLSVGSEEAVAPDQGATDEGGTVETPMDQSPLETESGEELLAGKFKTQEELEKSYVELQKKMSSNPETGNMDMSKFMEHVGLTAEDVATNWSTEGMLTEDQYNKFTKAGISRDVVDIFMQGQMALANQARTSVNDALDNAYQLAGGQEALENLLAWANNTIDDQRKETLNVRLDNPDTMESALKEILFDYKNAVGSGYTGPILSGDQMPNTSAGFNTVDEFTQAMRKVNDAGHLDEATRRRIANTPLHITQGLN